MESTRKVKFCIITITIEPHLQLGVQRTEPHHTGSLQFCRSNFAAHSLMEACVDQPTLERFGGLVILNTRYGLRIARARTRFNPSIRLVVFLSAKSPLLANATGGTMSRSGIENPSCIVKRTPRRNVAAQAGPLSNINCVGDQNMSRIRKPKRATKFVSGFSAGSQMSCTLGVT